MSADPSEPSPRPSAWHGTIEQIYRDVLRRSSALSRSVEIAHWLSEQRDLVVVELCACVAHPIEEAPLVGIIYLERLVRSTEASRALTTRTQLDVARDLLRYAVDYSRAAVHHPDLRFLAVATGRSSIAMQRIDPSKDEG